MPANITFESACVMTPDQVKRNSVLIRTFLDSLDAFSVKPREYRIESNVASKMSMITQLMINDNGFSEHDHQMMKVLMQNVQLIQDSTDHPLVIALRCVHSYPPIPWGDALNPHKLSDKMYEFLRGWFEQIVVSF